MSAELGCVMCAGHIDGQNNTPSRPDSKLQEPKAFRPKAPGTSYIASITLRRSKYSYFARAHTHTSERDSQGIFDAMVVVVY